MINRLNIQFVLIAVILIAVVFFGKIKRKYNNPLMIIYGVELGLLLLKMQITGKSLYEN